MACSQSMRRLLTRKVIIPTVVWFSYLALGAYMFSRIEGQRETHKEEEEKQWLNNLIKQTIRNVSTLQINFVLTETDDLKNKSKAIEDFIDEIMNRYHPEKRNYKWDMAGGVHFCLTVVSTIGYGLVVPRTQLGRAVCVIYAMIGIPINIIFMAGIGRVIARLIDRTYCMCLRAFRNCPCYKSQPKQDHPNKECCSGKTRQRRPSARSNQVDGEGAALPDPGAAKDKQRRDRLKEACDKVTRSSVFHVMYSDWTETSFTGSALPEVVVDRTGEAKSCHDGDKAGGPETEDLDIDTKDCANPLAPVWFVILFVLIVTSLVTIFMWFSGILENEWTLIDLIYFKFITYSTIGFGDLFINAPEGINHSLSVLLDVVVIVIGMSLVSTVINILTSSNRCDQALNFATCLLQTMWQFVSKILCRRDRT